MYKIHSKKEKVVKWRTLYKGWEGYWLEYDTHGSEERAREEYQGMNHKSKRLVRVVEAVVKEREDE